MTYELGEVFTSYWSIHDTPIPKVGEVLENPFREKFKILSRARNGNEVVIRMERIK